EFHGRIDNQVKLRGLRVELGEIESVINSYEGIRSSIVIVAHGETDYLAAYFTANREIDINSLKEHLSAYLTAYMVPQAFMQLDEMPLTANGKIDKNALPAVSARREMNKIKEPATQLQKVLCDIFANVLSCEIVGADENFFELGGTSLTAAKVMMAAMVKELPVSYQDIFDSPTAEGLERVILEKENSGSDEVSGVSVRKIRTVSGIDKALAHNLPQYVDEIHGGKLGNVLLTGATGFLGAHVLRELLRTADEKIYCLIRDKKNSAKSRLNNTMFYYFDDDFEEYSDRIEVIQGDMTDAEGMKALDSLNISTVINCAASVKHFGEFDNLYRINVTGVENLAKLCIRKNARLVHVSTSSVGGSVPANTEAVLYENTLDVGQEVESNVYVHTKYLAEKRILEMLSENKLDAKIMRVGNLMSRLEDGEFQMNFRTNNFMNTLRSYSVLGCFPVSELDEMVELSPIDETAKGIVLLAGTDSAFTVFHVYNSHTVEMADIIEVMQNNGIYIETVSDDEFEERMHTAVENADINADVAPLVNYNTENDDDFTDVNANNSFTVKALHRLGFKWSLIESSYLNKAIEMLKTLGFFDII
ncbi:MAG: SDR family oxidoreductase, partial [Clostridia bacterium]|nr:SDR family oxidoreductase [Clostridia bacterium]